MKIIRPKLGTATIRLEITKRMEIVSHEPFNFSFLLFVTSAASAIIMGQLLYSKC